MSSEYVWKLGIDICSCFIPDSVAEHVAKIAGARTGALDNKRNALPALADGLLHFDPRDGMRPPQKAGPIQTGGSSLSYGLAHPSGARLI